MSSILVELTANIVSSHAATVEMSSDELLQEIQKVYAALKNLDSDNVIEEGTVAKEAAPAISPKKSIQKDQIICLICGKGGFKTLSRHLKQAHGLKASEYRKQFGIASGTPLAAKNYSEARRQSAINNNLGEKLAKGRATRMANLAAKKATLEKPKKSVPAKAPKSAAAPRAKKK
ncbi:MucR family transcriptional regulator [Trichlorobacter lovleyi]|uniref:Transcriptional regulator, MucR family n=1 Tax=Trichlorobacter lovleyi (strain ATCC BAA-1151 / DSM 17278 / SZ) TaxID=398767 RepID=B3E4U2_TRIL1|nr:MucR family transcriptional regulator [Trichlorobacter lovleyi]ACD96028.1 transcriptional regulator, MucR family [Trichlorobacter lovleyi SZ]